ncbi:SIR2 family protein [Serratia liquefaciens]|uniref:SIR2 family protein n=1 Tax=Serratia liquefaciens TaxID=614 RepID=UPI0018E4C89A|nr:SIR2 family protein [Serratia liquefaciens]MBI6162548.1 SIR2 family protein [Serratia liquefaciens]
MNKDVPFKASTLVDKNINFLFGSGVSAAYIPTLWIAKDTTYEDILSAPKFSITKPFIYWSYYNSIIKKSFCVPDEKNKAFNETMENYCLFISKLVELTNKKGANQIRRANIFTTNYDLFIEKSADRIQGKQQFILNDGSLGLIDRFLNVSNFHISSWHQGTNDFYRYEIPTINLIKMHGSVSWRKESESVIKINYPETIPNELSIELKNKDTMVDLIGYEDFSDTPEEYLSLDLEDEILLERFYANYKKLAIVNPTKEKFEETVFQQHYYQSLRLLSYELEKPQTVLICFGFSFKDEHIREIISRSLSNPSLKIFIFCFKKENKDDIKEVFNDPRITFIHPENDKEENKINFPRFINAIFHSSDDNGTEGLQWTSL